MIGPRAVVGFLPAGGRATYDLSQPVPEGWVPVLFFGPRDAFELVDRSEATVTIANEGSRPGGFALVFAREKTVQTGIAVTQVSGSIFREIWRRLQARKGSPR